MAATLPRALPASHRQCYLPSAVRPCGLAARPARSVSVACQPSSSAAVAVTERVDIQHGQVQAFGAPQFDALCQAAESKLVVVDVFTTWCGPCKMIAPELEKMAADYAEGAVIAKIDCTQSAENKKWAMEHNVKALPTFLLFKDGKRVNDMTGAKAASLRKLIESHM